MHHQNIQEIYDKYTSKFPEVEENFNEFNIYESNINYSTKNHACSKSSDDECQQNQFEYAHESNKNTYDEWIQEDIVQQSQVDIIRTKTRTEYAKPNRTSSGKHYYRTVGKTHVTKQVSRRYLKKYYENVNFDSDVSNSRSSVSLSEDLFYDLGSEVNTKPSKTHPEKTFVQTLYDLNECLEHNIDPNEDDYSINETKENVDKVLIESRLQKFNRLVIAELKRRRDSKHIMLDPVTSDVDLLKAVTHLVQAENADTFHGAVHAAEEAAAKAPPDQAEEAAVAGAREYQAEVTDFIEESLDGWMPIKVIGYVGVTKPKLPTKS